MRKTRVYRKRCSYNKRLRDVVAGWRGGVDALVQVDRVLNGKRWLLGGGHATSCYTSSRLCTEVVVIVVSPVELPSKLDIGESFDILLRVVVRDDFNEVYQRGHDHHLMGRVFRIPSKNDLIQLLRDGDYKDLGDLVRLDNK